MRAIALALLCSFSLYAVVQGDGYKRPSGEEDSPAPGIFSGHRETAAAIFDRLDRDHDGSLTSEELADQSEEEEMRQLLHGMPISTFMILADENSDQLLEKHEYTAWFADHKVSYGTNLAAWEASEGNHNDGKLSFEEYLESPMGKYALTAPTGCPVDFNAGPEDTMCKNRPRSGIESAKMRFNSMDRDGDGDVSEHEYHAHVSADDFLAADRDEDGSIELEEYMQAPKHWRAYNHRETEDVKAEFKDMDIDRNGRVTRKEFENHLRATRLEGTYKPPLQQLTQLPDESPSEEQWLSYSGEYIANENDEEPNSELPNTDSPEDMSTSDEIQDHGVSHESEVQML